MKPHEMNRYLIGIGYSYLVFLAVTRHEKHPYFDEMVKSTTHPVLRVVTDSYFKTADEFKAAVQNHLDQLNCSEFKSLISGESWEITGASPFLSKAHLNEFLADSYAYTFTLNK